MCGSSSDFEWGRVRMDDFVCLFGLCVFVCLFGIFLAFQKLRDDDGCWLSSTMMFKNVKNAARLARTGSLVHARAMSTGTIGQQVELNRSGNVATITLNDPGRLNALTAEMGDQFVEVKYMI
jgi:predicted permease